MAAVNCGHFSCIWCGVVVDMLKKAFTLVELLMIVLFLGIMAMAVVPRFSNSTISKQNADLIGRKIVTDLRRTRSLAISDAANNTSGFSLNMTGPGPYTGYNIVNLKTSTTVDSLTITSGVSCTGGSLFNFGPLGNLLSGSDTQLVVSGSGKTCTINITSATGMVKCTEN
jgi:Tfp pilus assembly protein PilE